MTMDGEIIEDPEQWLMIVIQPQVMVSICARYQVDAQENVNDQEVPTVDI